MNEEPGHRRQLEQLERSIDQNRRELARAVRDLSRATAVRVDLRRELVRHPWAFVLASLALGLWLGARRDR